MLECGQQFSLVSQRHLLVWLSGHRIGSDRGQARAGARAIDDTDAASTATAAGAAKLPPPATHSSQLIDAMNWAIAANERQGSPFFHRLDTQAIGVMGHPAVALRRSSLRGSARTNHGDLEQRFVSRAHQMAGGKPLTKSDLNSLHAPTAYISGDAEDIAYANANDDFDYIKSLPVFRAYGRGILHSGTYGERNGGEFAGIAVAWLNWQLKGTRVHG